VTRTSSPARPTKGTPIAITPLPPSTSSRGWWGSAAQRAVRGPADLPLMFLDAVMIAVALGIMLALRFELQVPSDMWSGFVRYLPVAVIVHLVANRLAGLYGPVWQHASIYEAQRILLAGGVVTIGLSWWMLIDRQLPLSVALTGGVIATGLMGVLRFQSRLFAFHRGRRTDACAC
jgi:FlaA1/EpsC-like NDP-sugar epimerase